MNCMTLHSVGNVIIPADELHQFSEGYVETTNQWYLSIKFGGLLG